MMTLVNDDRQEHGDQDARERQRDVGQTHQERVDPAAEEPGQETDEAAGGTGERDADDRHHQRDPRAVQQAAQGVAPVPVGAEHVPGLGALEPDRWRQALPQRALQR
jgi:hypothetical protein